MIFHMVIKLSNPTCKLILYLKELKMQNRMEKRGRKEERINSTVLNSFRGRNNASKERLIRGTLELFASRIARLRDNLFATTRYKFIFSSRWREPANLLLFSRSSIHTHARTHTYTHIYVEGPNTSWKAFWNRVNNVNETRYRYTGEFTG